MRAGSSLVPGVATRRARLRSSRRRRRPSGSCRSKRRTPARRVSSAGVPGWTRPPGRSPTDLLATTGRPTYRSVMGMPGGQPAGPSSFLADIGKGRMLGRKAAAIERFDGTSWQEIGRYPNGREANTALDEAVGNGADPGTLRILDVAPSTTARMLMIAGVVLCVLAVSAIVWLFVGG